MGSNREIIKYGGLQHKLTKVTGTLRKKQKVEYGEEFWVCLCVHNDRIPFLEWYSARKNIVDHEPLKVVDLIGCQYVNKVIADDRCMVIGFSYTDRSPLELSAPRKEECKEWVSTIQHTLKRLNLMDRGENNYEQISIMGDNEFCDATSKLSAKNSVREMHSSSIIPNASAGFTATPSRTRTPHLNDQIPVYCFPSTASSNPLPRDENNSKSFEINPPENDGTQEFQLQNNSVSVRITDSPAHSSFVTKSPVSKPPPLPPRNSTSPRSKISPKAKNENSFPCATTGSESQYDYDKLPLPCFDNVNYDSLVLSDSINGKSAMKLISAPISFAGSQSSDSSIARSSRSSGSFLTSNDQNIVTETSSQYLIPLPLTVDNYNILPVDSTSTTTQKTQEIQFLDRTFDKVRTIVLPLGICLNDVAFVEINSRIWVAGWAKEQDSILKDVIKFGDEVLEIGGTEIHNGGDLINSFGSISSTTATNGATKATVSIKISSIPIGSTYSFEKVQNPKKSLGIVLHKRKNEIASVIKRSPADFVQLSSHMSPYIYSMSNVPASITEVNGIPLNPFAQNEQLFKRLEEIPSEQSFSLVIHPSDFVRLIKHRLKHVKGYKRYIHD